MFNQWCFKCILPCGKWWMLQWSRSNNVWKVCFGFNYKNSFHAYVKTLADLIWLMFSKNQSDSAKAPPIFSTLKEKKFRAHYITIQWKSAHISTPSLLDPNDYSWLFNEKGSSVWNCRDVFGTSSRIHYSFDRM